MTLPRRKSPWTFILAAILGIGTFAGLWHLLHIERSGRAFARDADADPRAKPISVKSAHPKRDQHFQITVDRPADVEAYYRANIEAQVAGEVKWIRVAPGSHVEKGDVLVRLHVPDKWALEREKKNIVTQRETEHAVALKKLLAAKSAVKTAKANVELKRTLLAEAKAETRLRNAQFTRLDQLFRKDSTDKNVRDEAERNLEWARASEVGAEMARVKADCELDDAQVNVEVTEADVARAKQLIEVARSDHEQAAAVAEYAVVKAPFPGAVVSRHINPGSFVQNASTGNPTALVSLERSDIVTVVMRVPDNYAPYINAGTEAVIEIDSLPGIAVHGKVTRFAPSLITAAHDRTMRVEVDLWNEASEKYKPFFADPKNLADLKDGPLPWIPDFTGNNPEHLSTRLIPGMYGKMTLILKSYGRIDLIPSQAIVRESGKTSIYVVRDGKAHLEQVQLQVDDGTLAHVLRLGKQGEILGELAETEEVVISNQEELSEGQTVKPTLRKDWGMPTPVITGDN